MLLGKLASFVSSVDRGQLFDGLVVGNGCLWISQHKYTHCFIPTCLQRRMLDLLS